MNGLDARAAAVHERWVYNERRPHHGYRLRGRKPAELFAGVGALVS
jgi:hypothetical protein